MVTDAIMKIQRLQVFHENYTRSSNKIKTLDTEILNGFPPWGYFWLSIVLYHSWDMKNFQKFIATDSKKLGIWIHPQTYLIFLSLHCMLVLFGDFIMVRKHHDQKHVGEERVLLKAVRAEY